MSVFHTITATAALVFIGVAFILFRQLREQRRRARVARVCTVLNGQGENMIQKLSRRNIGSALAGMIAGASAAVALPNVRGIAPLTDEQFDEVAGEAHFAWGFGVAQAGRSVRALSKVCPGIQNFIESRMDDFVRDLLARYPNLKPVIDELEAPIRDHYTGEFYKRLDAEPAPEQREEAYVSELQVRRNRAAENPPEWVVENAKDFLRSSDEQEFAGNLDLGRALWRNHRELVEADFFPEPFRSAIGVEPDEVCSVFADHYFQPDYDEQLTKEALDVASTWIRNGVAEKKLGFVIPA